MLCHQCFFPQTLSLLILVTENYKKAIRKARKGRRKTEDGRRKTQDETFSLSNFRIQYTKIDFRANQKRIRFLLLIYEIHTKMNRIDEIKFP